MALPRPDAHAARHARRRSSSAPRRTASTTCGTSGSGRRCRRAPGTGRNTLCSQIGVSSWICLLISATNASATVDVSFSSSNLRTMKLNRTCVVLVVDRHRGRDVDRVDDAGEPHLREAGTVVVDVDAAVRDAARRDVALLRQHRRERAVGVVALHLRDVVGAVHVAEVRGVDAVLRHLLRHRVDHVGRAVASRSTRGRRSRGSPGSPTAARSRRGGATT